MSARFLPVPWLFAGSMLAVTTAGMAETPARIVATAGVASEMSLSASFALPSSKNLSTRLRREFPPQDVFHGAPRQLMRPPGGCAQNNGPLCFDYRTGRAVYKPMRRLLPVIPGMTPHNLSIRRNRIVAEYSFK